MNVRSRKMFNRPARNSLNRMGGIASFANGGPTPSSTGIPSQRFYDMTASPSYRFFQGATTSRPTPPKPMIGPIVNFPNTGIVRTGQPRPPITLSQEEVNKLNQLSKIPSIKDIITKDLPKGEGISGSIQQFIPKQANPLAEILRQGAIRGGQALDVGVAGGKGLAALVGPNPNVPGAPALISQDVLKEGTITEDLRGVDITKLPDNFIGTTPPPVPAGTAPGTQIKIERDVPKGPDKLRDSDDLGTAPTATSTTPTTDTSKTGAGQAGAGQAGATVVSPPKSRPETSPIDPASVPPVDMQDPVEPQAQSKEDVDKIINEGTPEQQQQNLQQLMKEFTQNAPEYEGLDKGLAIAKIGFAMAAGKSPDAITNIANALNQGADMLIADKAKRDEFNRQVQLSALQYGLGEIGKQREDKRARERFRFQKMYEDNAYVVGPEGYVDPETGRRYKAGESVTFSDAFLAEKGLPPGIQNTTYANAILQKEAKVIENARKKAEQGLVKDPKKITQYIEDYSTASRGLIQASNAIKLTELFMSKVAEGDVTGAKPAFRSFLAKSLAIVGKDDKLSKKYTSRDEAVADMKKVFQELIPLTLGRDQAANSISDRDVDRLADAFVTEQIIDGGLLSLIDVPRGLILTKAGSVIKKFEEAQRDNIAKINGLDSTGAEFYTPSGQALSQKVATQRGDISKFIGQGRARTFSPDSKKQSKYARDEKGVIRLI